MDNFTIFVLDENGTSGDYKSRIKNFGKIESFEELVSMPDDILKMIPYFTTFIMVSDNDPFWESHRDGGTYSYMVPRKATAFHAKNLIKTALGSDYTKGSVFVENGAKVIGISFTPKENTPEGKEKCLFRIWVNKKIEESDVRGMMGGGASTFFRKIERPVSSTLAFKPNSDSLVGKSVSLDNGGGYRTNRARGGGRKNDWGRKY